jgi:glycosyltransferase involved in cell wall biosynthesis
MKISICIPTYNQAKYIESAIRSAQEQTIPIFEIIVSNDCSTDNTREVLEKLSIEIPILKIVNQTVNLGMNRNTDTCLRLGKGDFIIKLDSDDFLLPSYSEKLLNLMIQFPDAGYGHASVQEIDESGNKTRLRILSRNTGFYNSDKSLKSVVKGYRVAANIIMFRRKALEKVNYIESKINFAEDYYLSASLASADFGNVYLSEILSCYRVWDDAGKVRQRRKLDEINGLIQVYDVILEPAFRRKGWDLKSITNERKNKACIQMNCLGWDVYSREEKNEIENAIYRLSSSIKVKFYASIYKSKLRILFNLSNEIVFSLKSKIKNILFISHKKSFR